MIARTISVATSALAKWSPLRYANLAGRGADQGVPNMSVINAFTRMASKRPSLQVTIEADFHRQRRKPKLRQQEDRLLNRSALAADCAIAGPQQLGTIRNLRS